MLPRSLLLASLLFFPACTAKPINPSFPLTHTDARYALQAMRENPKPLSRPLVIVGGYLDPNVSPTYLKHQFKRLTHDDRILTVVVGFSSTFEEARDKVIRAVDEKFPTTDPTLTTEVDVIGASLGGLVSRYAAAPPRDASSTPGSFRRLQIKRLFTIASPHAGATLARHGHLNQFQKDLRPNSDLIHHLALHDPAATYQLFPYARLHDHLVGEHHSAPPGHTPLWLPTPILQTGHATAWFDPRILADISKHLRNETPFSTIPPTPLPR